MAGRSMHGRRDTLLFLVQEEEEEEEDSLTECIQKGHSTTTFVRWFLLDDGDECINQDRRLSQKLECSPLMPLARQLTRT